MEKTTPSIGVYNEWGRLREVVVGIVTQDVRLPPCTYSTAKYAIPSSLQLLQKYAGKRLSEVDPEALAQTREQVEALVRVYEKNGVTVFRPRLFTEVEEQFVMPGGGPLYVRDPMLVIGTHVIEVSLMAPYRRKEIFALREMLQKRLAVDPEARYVSMPHPLPSPFVLDRPEGPGPFLEGGDVFVMGKDVLVGNSGLASNQTGIAWLQRYLAPEGYTVHEVPLLERWLHLDCILAVVRRGLAMCDRSALRQGLPGPIKDWDIISATSEEAHALGCNAMCLAENVVVIAEEHRRLIKELERRKANVVSGFRMDVAARWGGGIRCASHPLRRDA